MSETMTLWERDPGLGFRFWGLGLGVWDLDLVVPEVGKDME